MKISNNVAEAIVGKVIEFGTVDAIALGFAFNPFKEFLAKCDAYNKWKELPYDKRNMKDENGNLIHPAPERPCMSDEQLEVFMRPIMKFVDKIAVYPSDSNIFE